jgi:hypothetical protein
MMSNSIQTTANGVPVADGFDFPVGPRGDDADVFDTHKVDTDLVDPAYFKAFGTWHTGEDWNGRGGGDSDLGDPIYAIAHGKVVAFGYYPPSWGNLVLIEHALPDGSRVWSQYAHLDKIMVAEEGQIVTRGQQIGTMGKGAKTEKYPQGRWIAHLHFEIRRANLPINNWTPMVKDREQVLANYINPTPFIKARRPHNFEQTRDALGKVQIIVDSQKTDPQAGAFRKANVDHWYSAPYGFQDSMFWTYAATEVETNWAEWRPNLPQAGSWEVWVYIPAQYATTSRAFYTMAYQGGQEEVLVNQNALANEWFLLGTYPFETGSGYVRLTDVTGESGHGGPLMIGFDAVCWTRVE